MPEHPPKATSVTEEGEPDGFEIGTGFWPQQDWTGSSRLVVSVPPARLAEAHQALLGALPGPWGVLYRQKVDRREPRPEGAPPRDFVALEIPPERLRPALAACALLVYHDARHELWLRGAARERQIVLDGDGLVYCYPDAPAFREILQALDLREVEVETLADRDYVKHWFHAGADPLEDRLIRDLGLTEVAPQAKG